MKTTLKTIVFALGLALAATAFAQSASVDWGTRISDLRSQHTELKAQVDAGEITAEEAREQWQEIMASAQAEKDAYFEARTERIEARIAIVAENNPDRAEQMQERLEAASIARAEARVEREALRAEIRAERQALRAQVEAGEITAEEARAQAEANRAENQAEREAAAVERRERAEAARTKREERRAERQENRPERSGQIRIDAQLEAEVQ